MRVGEDDLVARVAQRGEGQEHHRARPRGDEHVVWIHNDAVLLVVVPRDRLAQRDFSQAVGVVRLADAQGLHRGLADALGRGEVRLADLEVDHVPSRPLHRLRAFQDVHHDERRDLKRLAAGHGVKTFRADFGLM